MKIAFILSRCSNLGPFIVARDIVNNIYDKVDIVDVYYIKEDNLTKLAFSAQCVKIRFWEAIEFSKYDIVHSHGFVADAYVFFHKKAINCKHVITIHQPIAPDYTMQFNAFAGYSFEKIWCSFIRKNSLVVTLTKDMVSYYKRILHKNEITFIYNGIEPPSVYGSLSEDEEKLIMSFKNRYKTIGVTARLIFRKGIDQIIRALVYNTDFGVIVIGDGEKREDLIQLSQELNVNERCLFLGYKTDVFKYLRYFDVYTMSSRSEGFGLALMEAASQKIPVVCSDLPVFRELFTEDEVTRFELENIPSLVQALKKAIANKEILSENIYKKYKEHFTAEIMANNYLRTYKKLINQ